MEISDELNDANEVPINNTFNNEMIPDITFNINNNIAFNSSPNLIIGNLRNLIDDDNSNISIINNIHNYSIELSSSNDLMN